MYHSHEIRWFFQDDLTAFLHWFGVEETAGNAKSRTDHYLKNLGPDINIKLREGRIEIKQRMGLPKPCEINADITGKMEEWVKWSFDMKEAPHYLQWPIEHPKFWLPVTKTRRQRHFHVENGQVIEGPTPIFSQTGCSAELTLVRTGAQEWLSIGLEAFGNPPDLIDVLELTTRHFLDERIPVKLKIEQSMGYPEWFTKLKLY